LFKHVLLFTFGEAECTFYDVCFGAAQFLYYWSVVRDIPSSRSVLH